ncbi:nucleotide-binding universal stress UspA family protein [Saccharopolyspora erythraea NRRL 2338]|uniref:Universal stress protein family n=2 Tax=Saccharopolyspora erythraea TaxID=1836 RepID=A4FCH4_SACEN|nr:universal stress protein [Saccharopolyspora erythraea]EQD87439.1 stress-inducible protein [Saccharopolyspora erythraea D]PFG95512.1 nucleotide-binding universal stress UspA family protein [Saccharopolyspora erythraea NRRL 2338]QRK92139.1 universal stress protein [Saccharopolyspora erythraea]CAM01749.1 universal stress protein family [Saccharopolyspora erythraea NRRL 2338]
MSEGAERVVVGVDGSPGSKAALEWALRYADKTGARITAVAAWTVPIYYGDVMTPLPLEDFGDQTERGLSRSVEEVTAALGTDVPVERRVVQDIPARALVRAAEGADLLVVGSRGHGGFVGTLLGSVSQHCVHHAPCPLVVVRPAEREGAGS